MTYRPRRRCKRCDRDRDQCGGVSRSGLCYPCGEIVLAESLRGLKGHSGPAYDAWLDGLTDAVARLWGERQVPSQASEVLADLTLF